LDWFQSNKNTLASKRFSTLARVGGAGFRQLAKFPHRNAHFDRIFYIHTKTMAFNLEWWIGRGRPLNPYLRGWIIDFLVREMKPKELSLYPDKLFSLEGKLRFLEWSVLRGWMRQWLRYCHYYSKVLLSPDVTIQQFFEAPVVNQKWKIVNKSCACSIWSSMEGLWYGCFKGTWLEVTNPPFISDFGLSVGRLCRQSVPSGACRAWTTRCS